MPQVQIIIFDYVQAINSIVLLFILLYSVRGSDRLAAYCECLMAISRALVLWHHC